MPAHAEFLSIPETAELLRITERTTYQLARGGEPPALKVGAQRTRGKIPAGPLKVRRRQ